MKLKEEGTVTFTAQQLSVIRACLTEMISTQTGYYHRVFETYYSVKFTNKDAQQQLNNLVFDSTTRNTGKRHQHLEYLPLINARYHSLTSTATETKSTNFNILNRQLKQQYKETLLYCAQRTTTLKTLPMWVLLSLVSLLLVQDRLADAIKVYSIIQSRQQEVQGDMEMKMQRDYLYCYLTIATMGSLSAMITAIQANQPIPTNSNNVHPTKALFEQALTIAAQYAKYPVASWREMFSGVQAYVDEALESTEQQDQDEYEMLDDDGVSSASTNATHIDKANTLLNSAKLNEFSAVDDDAAHKRDKKMSALAVTEPILEMELVKHGDSHNISLTYANIKREQVQVKIHYMDTELLLSSNPFLKQDNNKFNIVTPSVAYTVPLYGKKTNFSTQSKNVNDLQSIQSSIERSEYINNVTSHTTILPLPSFVHGKNLYLNVSVTGTNLVKQEPLFSHTMNTQVIEGFGQVKVNSVVRGVNDQGMKILRVKPLAGVYVKCYAEMNSGVVDFYHDGYTDIRGRFDYASLSSDKLKNVKKFSLLIIHDTHGTCVQTAQPPAQ